MTFETEFYLFLSFWAVAAAVAVIFLTRWAGHDDHDSAIE
jgi:hypothetical protein